MKIFNIKGIVIILSILVVIQVAVGLVISPIVGPIIIDTINKHAGTRISIEKVNVWPLTLSCSLKNLKVFDPDKEKERIAIVKSTSIKLSPVGLLSKRIIISRFVVSGAEITLKGEPDGSFNVQKLARPKDAAAKTGVLDRFKGKKDWFTRIYDMIRNRSSKEAIEKKTAEKKDARKVEKKIEPLPHGRLVKFVKPSDQYVFQIRDLAVHNSVLKLITDTGESLDVDKTTLYIKNLGLDPSAGARFDRFGIKGVVNKNGKSAGSFDFDYAQSFRQGRQTMVADFSAKDIDLTAVKFIYQDSLPVDFQKGIISIDSHTNIVNGELDSSNSVTLKDHTVLPKNNNQVVGFVPLPVICDALNEMDPVKLKFQIGGTVDNPKLENFEDTLLNLIKPYMANAAENLQKQGLKALDNLLKKETGTPQEGAAPSSEEDTAAKTIESIKSLFGSQNK